MYNCRLSSDAGNNTGLDGLLVIPCWIMLILLVDKTSTVLIFRSKRCGCSWL